MFKKDIEDVMEDIRLGKMGSKTVIIDTMSLMVTDSQPDDENVEPQNNTKPCPFCGGEVSVVITDDEGNFRDEDYARDPWSGLSFALYHDNEDNLNCPISNHVGEILGSTLYNTEKDAVLAWETRQG